MSALAKFAELPWPKVMMAAAGAVAVYYFLQYDDGSRLRALYEQKQSEMKKEEMLLKKTQDAMKDLERFKDALNSQSAQVREILNFLPKQMNTGELLTSLQDRASQAGMRVLKVEPQDQVTKIEFYEYMKIDIQLQGTYSQVATFLSLLSKLPRLLTLEKIKLATSASYVKGSATDGGTKIDFAATIIAYRYAEEAKASDSAPEAQAGGQPPPGGPGGGT
jgi:type IV pilus assembly protein PilO